MFTNHEKKISNNYLKQKLTYETMLKHLIEFNHLSKGELFDLIFGINSKIKKENTILKSIVLINLLVSLICMILLMLR